MGAGADTVAGFYSSTAVPALCQAANDHSRVARIEHRLRVTSGMAALIAAGSALSWLLSRSAGPIALASFVAFAVSATLDAIVYAILGSKSYALRVNGSNVVSAAESSS